MLIGIAISSDIVCNVSYQLIGGKSKKIQQVEYVE